MQLSKLFKVASKSTIKPELTHLYLKEQKLYATDSFKAVIIDATEYTEPEDIGFITLPKAKAKEAELKALKIKVTVLPDIDNNGDHYPDFNAILPKDEALNTEYFKANFNRQYIIDLLEAMQKGDAFDQIDLFINKDSGHQKPLVFKNKNGTGLIMPLNK
jgi:hypothetical protein